MRLLIARLWLLAIVLGSWLATARGVEPGEPQNQSPAAAQSQSAASDESPAAHDADIVRAKLLARHVTIYRDAWGVPHIDGDTDESLLFGFAYAQAEDYFWQLEDSYVLSLGRYSEVHGPSGVNSDLLNHTFEVVPIAQAAYARADSKTKLLCEAFALGLNYYLATHPEVQPRLIRHFEPWHVLAFGRQITLELCYRYTRLSQGFMPRSHRLIWAQVGSNGWAIGPTKTRSGHAMLFANPHQPWFGFGQMYEAHLRSGEGWNFTGATLFGNPMLSLGHNEHLGWTLTTNEPDIADVWRLAFDDPENPLHYRGPNGDYLTATQWDDTIKVKTAEGMNHRDFKLRKTKFGPIVAREDDQHYLAARIAGFENTQMMRQSLEMARAKNLEEFKGALALQQFPIMNVIYADCQGNIFFLYNGLIPRRDPQIDWRKPVDATQPHADWQGIHTLDELPQVLNPPSGYLQNCNSSPFTVCERGNCDPKKYPPYMAEDADDDKRRAKMSRELLEESDAITLERLQELAFDTTIYWAKHALPEYARRWEKLRQRDPTLAGQVEPYLKHLLAWDCRVTADSTQATLCEAWYTELYGMSYPGDQLQARYVENPDREFQALVQAAVKLTSTFGNWRVAWGEVFRMQRRANIIDLLSMPFDDQVASLPCLGVPGPMGAVFTQYYAPSVRIRFIRPMKKRYGLLGTSYVGVYEFDQRVRGASLVNFGESGNPTSPHYFDQAKLLSDRKLKPELFYWDDVVAAAKQTYHPGETPAASMAAQ